MKIVTFQNSIFKAIVLKFAKPLNTESVQDDVYIGSNTKKSFTKLAIT